jgi:hypothetical protein
MSGFDNDVVYAANVDFSGNSTVTGQFTTDGQMLIGSTAAPNIKVGTIANGNNLTWTYGSGSAQANLTGTTDHAVQVGNASGSLTSLATGTAGQVLQSGGASANPAYSTATYPSAAGTTGTILRSNGTNWINTTATYPTTTTANRILYSSATNTIGEITSVSNSILATGATGIPSLTTTVANDFSFTGSSAGIGRSVTVSHSDNTSGSSESVYLCSVGGTSGGDCYTRYVVGTARSWSIGIDNSNSQAFRINTFNNGSVGPSTGTLMMNMDTSGNRSLPLNSCCTAELNTGLTNATGDGTFINPLIFDTDSGNFFDQNGNYDTATGLFTAPMTGKYLVTARVTLNNLGAAHTDGIIRISRTGVTSYMINQFNPGAGRNSANEFTCAISGIIPLAATNTCSILIQVSGSTKTVGVKGNATGSYTSLSIVLVS